MSIEARVAELNLELPPAPAPGGNYTPVVQVHDMCYVSGHGPVKPDGEMLRGRVGSEVFSGRWICSGPAGRTGDARDSEGKPRKPRPSRSSRQSPWAW